MKIDNVFSKKIADLLKSTGSTSLNNIDKELSELIVAGCSVLENKNILWIVGENENLREKKQKLQLWLNFLAPDRAEANICFYTTPFEDPYINNSTNLNAVGHKAKLITALLNPAQGENIDSPSLTDGEDTTPAQNKEKTALQPPAGTIVICTLSSLSIKIEPRTQLQRFAVRILVRRGNEAFEQRVRLVRFALEFRMELAGDVERVIRQFDDFHQLFVRRGA